MNPKSNINQIQDTLIEKISTLIEQSRQRALTAINLSMVYTYYEIGRYIVEDEQHGETRANYGKTVLKSISQSLTKKFGKGFSVDNLQNMRTFYTTYSKYETHSRNSELSNSNENHPKFYLSYSHYLKLMRIQDENERRFYEIEASKNNWSLRELQRQYDTALYGRLILSTDKSKTLELSKKGHIPQIPKEAIKDPYILEFLELSENKTYSESELEAKIIDKLEHFLLELGNGFLFHSRQKRLTIDEKHFRIDLVFYNRILKNFVLIDLKIGELKHQDIGQMQMYVNYFDRFMRMDDENKTIGIILCQDKSDLLVEITLPEENRQIFASRYQTVLPTKEDFVKLLSE